MSDQKRYYGSMISLMCILLIAIISLCVNIYSNTNDTDKGEEVISESDEVVSSESKEDGEVAADILQAAIPAELQELLQKNPDAKDFVDNYPNRSEYMGDIDISSDYIEGTIPMFYQWDKRWGYQSYGDGIIALEGCGPTCLSMVAVGLTGNLDYNPKHIADMSYNNGFYAKNSSKWELMCDGAKKLGLTVKELPLWKNSIDQELKQGNPIICIMGPGDFTDEGHFVVITAIDANGYKVNDPNSKTNSEKIWSYEELQAQIKNIWAYSI